MRDDYIFNSMLIGYNKARKRGLERAIFCPGDDRYRLEKVSVGCAEVQPPGYWDRGHCNLPGTI